MTRLRPPRARCQKGGARGKVLWEREVSTFFRIRVPLMSRSLIFFYFLRRFPDAHFPFPEHLLPRVSTFSLERGVRCSPKPPLQSKSEPKGGAPAGRLERLTCFPRSTGMSEMTCRATQRHRQF